MGRYLDKFEKKPTSLNDLEDVMVNFGYEAWPWNKAYREFFVNCEKRMGGHFLSSKSDLAINEALFAIQSDLRALTNQEILSTERANYLRRVEEYGKIAASVQKIISGLRQMAEAVSDHPVLADEIRSKVKGFEHSLCGIGPELDCLAVEKSPEFFEGRKAELNHLRGINNSVVINFEE